jgi:hypothetical protein
MSNFNLTFPIDFIKKESRIVTGIATADNIDKVGDVVDFDASIAAFKNWQGNIREMHAPIAVGKAISYKPIKLKGPDGVEYNAMQVEAYISKGAENTWQKILDGTLRAFSIGGKIVKKELMQDKMHNGRQVSMIKEYELGELSLVDNPANPVAIIDIIKFDPTTNNLDYILKMCDGDAECVCSQIEKKQPIKDPKGGLTAAGRRHFKQKEGANLKPGVKGAADTPEKMRRKGSFLTRFFTNPSGPMTKPNGEPTRLALSATAWGEPVPKNAQDAARLAAKGRRLLERYQNAKDKNKYFSFEDDETIQKYIEQFIAETSSTILLNDVQYDKVVKPMENLNKNDDQLSFAKRFISWLTNGESDDNALEKSVQAEASNGAEVSDDETTEEIMNVELLKEALGSVIDQKLNDFATSLKTEVEASVAEKIDEVAKSLNTQKEELSQKLEATEKALEQQTAKVEELAQAGAVKKSVDPEDNGDDDALAKSESPASFWNNVYLPQGLINSLGYKS